MTEKWPTQKAWAVTIDWGYSASEFVFAIEEEARREYGWLEVMGRAKRNPAEVALWEVWLPEADMSEDEVTYFCWAHCPHPSESSPVRKIASQGSPDGWMLVPIPDEPEEGEG